MALFRDEPVHEVARRLNICAQGLASDHLLTRSGVTEARKRLGADPVEWLFRKTGNHWGAERYDDDAWHDLQVFAVDGALGICRPSLYRVLRRLDIAPLKNQLALGSFAPS